MYQASEAILIAPTALRHGFGTGRIARLAGGKAGKSMDERIESFLADVLALEGEDANAIREGGAHSACRTVPCAGDEQTNAG
jgi:hypothetical protein